ncbi:MAG: tol-pal system protein YbgF [Gammaproteobacteria bacterium]
MAARSVRRGVRQCARLALGVCILGAFASLPPMVYAADGEAVDARLQRLERKLDNAGLLDLVRQLDQLQQEVRRLRGEIENQAYTIEQLRNGQRDVYANLDSRLGVLEQGGTISVPGATAAAGAYGANPTAPAQVDPPLPTLPATGGSSVAGQPAEQTMALAVEGSPVYQAPPVAPVPTVSPGGTLPPGAIVANAVPQPPAPSSVLPSAPPGSTGATLGEVPVSAPQQVVAPAALAPAMVVNAAPPAPAGAAAVGTDSPESEAAYRDAFTMLKAGQYEDSIAAFNTYLQQYPGSQFADNAQYWLGEAYYVLRQFEPAIEQYQKLVQNYPASQKQSHALLKIAYSYSELGLNDQALAVLNDLKARFPGSAAARLADERIQRIRAQAP